MSRCLVSNSPKKINFMHIISLLIKATNPTNDSDGNMLPNIEVSMFPFTMKKLFMLKFHNSVCVLVWCVLLLLFQISPINRVPFYSVAHFYLSEGKTTEPVNCRMELQKLSKGNQHHEADVPKEGGYVSYICPTILYRYEIIIN